MCVCVCVCVVSLHFLFIYGCTGSLLQELSLVAASEGFSLQRLSCCGAQALGIQAAVVAAFGL